ncbi:MAG: YifB family Mg chelatase-like AAA ATPase [Eubacterium sp.]|jgi:magnesium chelatase family protein|nr:YifB family Mg chelatase-like AAA ATPase [Eubacterium sp.]
MFKKTNAIGLFGMNAFPVTVEINKEPGIPRFDIVGLADASVQESRMRIESALINSGVSVDRKKRVVNLVPASVKKSGSMYDLAILVAVLAADRLVKLDISRYAFIGETSLNGDLVSINGALTMVIAAREQGMKGVFLPEQNAREAAVVEGIDIHAVKNIAGLIRVLREEVPLITATRYKSVPTDYTEQFDFSDVRGQENAKRAIEIAAAGFHNIIMIGTPGTGKSMLAKRIPTILPLMSFEESLETTSVHSVAGILDINNPLVVNRPFRVVSHTASSAGLIGGGGIPQPGEISLAHNGVLFLDELPEFDRRTLETLRQPLEDGVIHISRAIGKASYPCKIMLVAAMNPCPCENFGHQTKKCNCTDKQITAYLSRISQPVLDRIDIQVEVSPVNYEEISANSNTKSEASKHVRERVEKARLTQLNRYKGTSIRTNSEIPPGLLHDICEMDEDAKLLLKNAFERLGISARAYDRILKVARTVADLSGSELIRKPHISSAITYRSLDKKYWNR